MFKTSWTKKLLAITLSVALLGSGAAALQTPTAAAYSATKANNIIKTGNQYLGVKYKFGAPSGITSAFDCSSFTQYVYKRNGISLPRTSKAQATKGTYVSKANLKKGDLVFFRVASRGSGVGHVGIYTGNGQMLHTYGKGGVHYTSINKTHWKNTYITARRVIK